MSATQAISPERFQGPVAHSLLSGGSRDTVNSAAKILGAKSEAHLDAYVQFGMGKGELAVTGANHAAKVAMGPSVGEGQGFAR